MKKLWMLVCASFLLAVGLFGTTGIVLADDPPGHGNDFVCPVITSDAMGEHNPNAVPLGDTGHWTVGPSTTADHLNVPDQATNGGGDGVPGGPHSAPGDTDYTAIWNGD